MIGLDAILDRIMKRKLIKALRIQGKASSSALYRALLAAGEKSSLVTVRRELRRLVALGVLAEEGKGRSLLYTLTEYGKLVDQVDARVYCAIEPDARYGAVGFNFQLLPAITFDPFSRTQMEEMEAATAYYHEQMHDVSPTLHAKELERFVIELSWKSSKIEGNTYTLLDTEKLLREGVEALGHAHAEAQMILNHKTAFSYIRAHADRFQTLTRANMEDVHKLLVTELGVTNNLRKKPVGVSGSRYRPLDNEFQIVEAVEQLASTVASHCSPYAKALIALVGMSYIQPFEDGNKRTSRLMANALLLSHHLAPLSYRSVSEEAYREAVLVFYELNSLVPFAQLFAEQYVFAARNYLAG